MCEHSIHPLHHATIFLKTCFFSIFHKVSQELITDQVKALAAKGASGKSLVDLGYDRIGIDDGWQVRKTQTHIYLYILFLFYIYFFIFTLSLPVSVHRHVELG